MAAVEAKICKLLDLVEVGRASESAGQRLEEREAEKKRLEEELAGMEALSRAPVVSKLRGKVKARIRKTLSMVKDQRDNKLLKEELKRHIASIEAHPDGRIKIKASLSSLLDETLSLDPRNSGSCPRVIARVGFEPTTCRL